MAARERGEAKTDPTQARQAAGIDQVREILFGAIYRELERKLVRADAHLATRTEELQQDARRRVEVLEAHVRREIEALSSRLVKEHVNQVDALGQKSREHRDAMTALEQRVATLEEALVRAQRELRQELLGQTKAFLDEIHRSRAEVTAALESEVASLREEQLPDLPSPTEGEEATTPSAH